MVGNTPFEHIALTTETNKTIKLIFKHNTDNAIAHKKIGQRVYVKGKIKIKALKTADNKYNLSEYRLIVSSIRYKGHPPKTKKRHKKKIKSQLKHQQ